MQNCIDDILVHAAIAVNRRESWQSKESENFQIVPDPENDV